MMLQNWTWRPQTGASSDNVKLSSQYAHFWALLTNDNTICISAISAAWEHTDIYGSQRGKEALKLLAKRYPWYTDLWEYLILDLQVFHCTHRTFNFSALLSGMCCCYVTCTAMQQYCDKALCWHALLIRHQNWDRRGTNPHSCGSRLCNWRVIKSNTSQSRDLSCCSHTWEQDAFPLLSAPGWACGEAVTSSCMLPVPRYQLHAGVGTAEPQAELGSRIMVALHGQPGATQASARTSAGGLKVHLIESLCRGVSFAGSSVLWMQCAASVHSLPLGWKLLGSMSNYWRGKVALLKWILILSVFKSNLDLEQSKTKITKCPFLPLGCGPCFCCVGSCGLRIVTQMQLWIRGSSQICHLCTKQS